MVRRGEGNIAFVTALRALACLMVVYCHLVDGATRQRYHIGWAPAEAVNGYILAPLGIIQGFGFLGVALFFLISGFIVTHASQRDSSLAFFIKRTLRIYPPLFAAFVVTLALYHADRALTGAPNATASIPWRDVALGATLANVFFFPGVVPILFPGVVPILAVAWTLSIEMVFYLHLTPLVPLLRSRIALAAAILSLWSVAAIEVCSRVYLAAHWEHANAIGVMLEYLPVFACGMISWGWWQERIVGRWAVILGAGAYLCVVHNMWRIQPSLVPEPNAYIAQIAYAAALFVGCLLVADRIAVARPVRWVAEVSYSLYLVHFPVGFWLLDHLVPHIGYTAAIAVTLGMLCALSYGIWRYVERPLTASRALAAEAQVDAISAMGIGSKSRTV